MLRASDGLQICIYPTALPGLIGDNSGLGDLLFLQRRGSWQWCPPFQSGGLGAWQGERGTTWFGGWVEEIVAYPRLGEVRDRVGLLILTEPTQGWVPRGMVWRACFALYGALCCL